MNNFTKNAYRVEVGEVMDCIRYIFKAIRVSSSQFEKAVGLSAAQIFVLRKVAEEPGLSINDLAARTTTHQSSVSVVVKKLEDRGLVIRSTSSEDSRRINVTVTDEGKKMLEIIPSTIPEQMVAALEGMNPEKTQQLSALMREFVVSAGIADINAPAPMFEER